jgi:hypothetical protein
MLILGALTWAAEWYDPEGPLSPDEIADELMGILTSGIVKDVRPGRSGKPSTN